MKVHELAEKLDKMPPNDDVFYVDNEGYVMDISAVNHFSVFDEHYVGLER